MIQVRHVPEPLHRKLKARAATQGLSLSDYLLREMKRIAEIPTVEELKERLARLPSVNPRESAADAIRAERENRIRHLDSVSAARPADVARDRRIRRR